jgi:hypothetical protein
MSVGLSDEEKEALQTIHGTKYDGTKLRWDLLPLDTIEDVVKVLTFGANKYGANNWKEVNNAKERYFAALMRHIVAWRLDEKTDSESGISHIAHAICNLIFLDWFDNEK